MTIAGVYLSPEGVVLGADSTSSVSSDDGFHFYDFNQKLFEIGQDSTLGLLTWGLGGFVDTSYRTLIATFSDQLIAQPATSVMDAATRWTSHLWAPYCSSPHFVRFAELQAKAAHGMQPNAAGTRTADEQKEWAMLKTSLVLGFCIAGYVTPGRVPEAVHVTFRPEDGMPTPVAITQNSIQWWGVPNFFKRLLRGADDNVLHGILASGKWSGTAQELNHIVNQHTVLPNGTLPIRDAIDYVHTCIYCTVKAIKFSGLPQVCGGPIELAVITSDRKFRWVRHKPWDAAILEGALV